MSPEACGTQEVLPYWRWNMKQKLSSGYRYKDQTFSYSCVCPSTSKVPYPSDTGRRLGITNFVWSGYWQRLQIMSGNSLVLRPDSLSGHFFLVEVVEQGLSHEGKLGSAFSWAFWEPWSWLSLQAPVSQNSFNLRIKAALKLPKMGRLLWLTLWTTEATKCFLSAWAANLP